MIILEGPDGGGKTTLLKSLQELFPMMEVAPKAVSSAGEGVLSIQRYVEDHLYEQRWKDKLYDRFALISGPIYGAQQEMKSPNDIFMDFNWTMVMESRLWATRPLIVYCLPHIEIIQYNLSNDRESQGVVGDRISAIYWAYHARAARDVAAGIACTFDYTRSDSLNILRSRIDFRRREAH